MANKYYSLPLKMNNFITNNGSGTCSIEESIAHHLHLITTSYMGDCTFDETLGCAIWEIDFDNLKSKSKLSGVIAESLLESLNKHEKRLYNLNVIIKIKQEEISAKKEAVRVKKRVDITIKGKIKKTNEDYSYVEYFYIGPLSY